MLRMPIRNNPKALNAAKIAASLFIPGTGAALLVAELVGMTGRDQEDVATRLKNAADETAFQREMKLQQGLLALAEGRAQIARELAIARRIDTAEEVEIEEFYDAVSEGQGGLKVNKDGGSLGGSGSAKKITKRVYRFKGWRDGGLEELTKKLEDISPEELEALRGLNSEE